MLVAVLLSPKGFSDHPNSRGFRITNKKTATLLGDCFYYVGAFLLSRAVASQVSSASMSLTSVFGMGTGGPSS